jgi:uncharacterized protein (DUF4415 family)
MSKKGRNHLHIGLGCLQPNLTKGKGEISCLRHKHVVIIFRYVHNSAMAQPKKRQKAKQRKAHGKKLTSSRKATALRAAASGGKSSSGRNWQADIGSLYKPIKKPVTLRLDADVLAWFKVDGRGYQTRINKVLRKLMTEQRKRS